jgi:peptidyl-prolyl cis-trans isomerase A (cyclophilin A)
MNVAFAVITLALQGILAAEAPSAPPADADKPAAAPAKAPDAPAPTPAPAGPVVVLQTTAGDITLELDAQKAPISTANFLKYVRSGHYDGTIFHRVISNFMIQGGGMNVSMIQKPTGPPIKNEHSNGLKNERGTISMARTSAPDSATSQFFINLKYNDFLDKGDGYAVFGKVVEGLEVVD